MMAGALRRAQPDSQAPGFSNTQPGIMKGQNRVIASVLEPRCMCPMGIWVDTRERVSLQYPSIVHARMCMFGPSSPSIRPTSPVQAGTSVNCQDVCVSRNCQSKLTGDTQPQIVRSACFQKYVWIKWYSIMPSQRIRSAEAWSHAEVWECWQNSAKGAEWRFAGG